MGAHSPSSGSSVNESCAQDTEQILGKHGSGVLLSPFPLFFVAVLVEQVGCLSSGDRDRGLRIWNEREARRNDQGTRCWLSLERVRNSLLVVTSKSQILPWMLLQPQSQNPALEAQLLGQQNIAQSLEELRGAVTTVLNRSQAPTRRMLVDPKGLGNPPVFSGREEDFYVWTKKVENYVSGVFPNVRGALVFAAESQDVVTAATVAVGEPELGVEMSPQMTDSSSLCGQPSRTVKASTLSCQQEVTMAPRAGASCMEGGTRTQRDEREVS